MSLRYEARGSVMKRQEKPFCIETDAAQRVTFEVKEIIAAPANPEPDKAVEKSSIEVGLRDEPLMTESRVREIVRELLPAA